MARKSSMPTPKFRTVEGQRDPKRSAKAQTVARKHERRGKYALQGR